MSAVREENKMGVMPVGKLLISMALPMILSMLVQALYNIVDSIFVSRISQDALSAVSLAFSLQNLMIAVGAGTGVGINAFLSRSLGEKDYETANKVANHTVYFWGISYLIFLTIGLTLTHAYYASQTSDAAIINYGLQYTDVILCCSFGLFAQMFSERLLTSTGRTFLAMVIQMTGACINMVLDPIMIFGLLGFPALGIRGAAIATCTGQCIAGVLGIILNFKKNKDIELKLKYLKPEGYIFKRVYKVGIPSIVMGSIGSVMVYGLNKIIIDFTKTAVAVFGAYFKLQSFVFMPIFGLNNGIIPIIAYNYGARKTDRIYKTIRLALVFAICTMSVGLLTFETIPQVLLSLFRSNDPAENAALIEIGVPALRIIGLHFIVAGFCIVIGSTFQALGKANYSLVVSLMRQLVVLLPAAYLLSLTGNLNNVWFAFPIAECMSFGVTTFFYRTRIKKLIDSRGTENDLV
ncbi:MAG: MATE family efflux transporter [Clostridia bacterium]|nr:MATE family efflux transporter [Clostridia bacterium]MBR6513094.1 MATE family efflux transporter [Clostridia bacterium]